MPIRSYFSAQSLRNGSSSSFSRLLNRRAMRAISRTWSKSSVSPGAPHAAPRAAPPSPRSGLKIAAPVQTKLRNARGMLAHPQISGRTKRGPSPPAPHAPVPNCRFRRCQAPCEAPALAARRKSSGHKRRLQQRLPTGYGHPAVFEIGR